MKIDASAERGDKSAKLVVKVDLEGVLACVWEGFGGLWASKLEPS